jgi:protoporphyrinogen/coproporphyrinogen III oxidase
VADVLIVGGGISGLATAHYLEQQGLSVVLVEAQSRLGGMIATEQRNGCYLEAGPDSYIATKPAVTQLAESIPGLASRIVGSNDAARRVFVAKEGRLVPIPRGMAMMVPGEWRPAIESPLFSAVTKLRFFGELGYRPRVRREDVTISEFIKDHFDETVLEYVTEPLLTGVYGGEAGKLSARSVLPRFVGYEEKYGSLIRGVRWERAQRRQQRKQSEPLFLSFENGMQTLVDGVAGSLGSGVRIVHGLAERAAPAPGGGWKVMVGGQCEEAARLVLACPAFRAASIIEDADPGLCEELNSIPYSSAITVMMGYEGAQLNHPLDGFGFLVPRRERKSISACTWINTKFPSRIAPGWAVLRAFIVGREADELMAAGDEDLSGIVAGELRRFMGTCSRAWFTTVQRWPQSMPQYVVGHQERAASIEKRLSEHKGLYLVGNAYDGVGIPDCVRLAKNVAQRIAAQVRETREPPS